MTIINNFGWTTVHNEYAIAHAENEMLPGRVISIKGFKYILITSRGELETELSGKLLYGASQEDLPKVGDWVFYMDYDPQGYIIGVFPRTNELARKTPGSKMQRQILATNVDMALIVQGLDHNFNLMRLERYIVQLESCNIKCIVILNKADLVADEEACRAEVARLGRDCQIIACSTYTQKGLDQLVDILEPLKTYVLIGSSGVGKSSLLNYMRGDQSQKTAETSISNSKGRHTTTTRDLFKLPNGSLMIDTPGMREFGVTHEDGQPSSGVFPMIDKFAADCRYSDCTHTRELGCSVLSALEAGELDAVLYESYRKLKKEQSRFEISADDKKRFGKLSGKISREANSHRKKNKY